MAEKIDIKTAIIFGISGQDGLYLKKILLNENIKVYGTTSKKKSKYDYVNLNDFEEVNSYIKKVSPDYIFCFSAVSKTSHEVIFQNQNIICNGTLNILESIKINFKKCKIFIPGSALQFKLNNESISEKTEFYANNPYSISRIYTYNLSKYYREKYNLKIYYGFLFHHDSPFNKNESLTMQIIKSVKDFKKKNIFNLNIKNLNYTKEFNHAYDITMAIWSFVNQNKYFEMVIGSGNVISIKDFIFNVFNVFKIKPKSKFNLGNYGEKIIVKSDPQLLRSIGWKPIYGIIELIEDLKQNDYIN